LTDDGTLRLPGLGAVALERLLQLGSQSEGFGHGLSSEIQIVQSVSRLLECPNTFQDPVKHLLLVGGGHSHLAVLKSFGDAPAEGVHLALLSPNRHTFYSGMVPGVVAGHYRPGDCRIDLRPLAARSGARFLEDSAVGV